MFSTTGSSLPSPRLISATVSPDVDSPSQLDTHNVMQWGQFVDHDVTFTPVTRLSSEEAPGILCCNPDGTKPLTKQFLHPACFPIEIPADDPFFSQFGQRCMNFVRSVPAPQLSCSFGFGEQMNQITHFLDSSNVYGSDEEDEQRLREFTGGLLRTFQPEDGPARSLLPQEEEGEAEGEECAIPQSEEDRRCFKAGLRIFY